MTRFLRFQVAWLCHSVYSDASGTLYTGIKPVSSTLLSRGRHLGHMFERDVVAISCGNLAQTVGISFWKRMKEQCLPHTQRSSLCGRRPARQPWLDRIPGVAKVQCKKEGFGAVKDRSDPMMIPLRPPTGLIGDAMVTCRSWAMLTGKITANQSFII